MFSFGIVSLYTYIPLDEPSGIIINCVYQSTHETFYGLPLKLFERVFYTCREDNILVFNEVLYKRMDGPPIGWCVSFV